MSTLGYDLQLAKSLIEGIYLEGSFFDKIYPFTTENISGYIDYFDLKDRTLLTVGSSGDQVINAILNDVKEVTLLDKNPFIKFSYFLKVAAINTLSRDEFMKFYIYRDYPTTFKYNSKVFDLDTYKRIEKELKKLDFLSYMYWGKLYDDYCPYDIRNNLFHDDEVRADVLPHFNRYLRDDDTYKETRRKLNDKCPSFVIDNVLCPFTTKKFDNIWLANITSYIDKYEDIKLIIDNMFKLLNEGGLMEAGYLYEVSDEEEYNEDWQLIYNIKYILELLKEYNPSVISFIGEKSIKFQLAGYNDCDRHDSIIMCRKLKK